MVAVGAIAHHEGVKRGEQEAAAYDAPADGGYAEPAYAEEPAYAQAPAETAYAPPPADPADEIEHLAQLHSSGVLTDDEFAAAKAKVLGA